MSNLKFAIGRQPTYQQALDFLDGKTVKKVAYSTYLWKNSALLDTIEIIHHVTSIVTLERVEGGTRYTINSGGYRTPTTKHRINYFSPARLYQEKGSWKLSSGDPYIDGMQFTVIDEASQCCTQPGVCQHFFACIMHEGVCRRREDHR